jgi:ABC-type branched-subunit amino acid transport system substrate-binding protein
MLTILNRARTLRVAASGVALALVAAACGSSSSTSGGGGGTNQASAPGITANSISLGTTQPLTGPAAPGYSEIAPAANAMFKWQNAHGGVFGRTINLSIENDQYNPANTTTLTRKLVLQDQVFADFDPLGTPTQLSVQSFLNQQKVPQVFIASGCACWNKPSQYPYSFGWQPNYIIEGKILGKYIHDKFAGKKVAYLYQDDEFGQDGVKGLDQQIPGSDQVTKQTYDVTTLSAGLGNQMAAIKGSGAQVVALYTIPAATALAMLAAAQIGYHPQFVVSNVGADTATLTGLLTSFSKGAAGQALLSGLVTNLYLPSVSDTSGWNGFFMKVLQTYDQGAPWDGNTQYGLAVGYTMVQLLKAAGRNPTRDSLVSTLENSASSLGGPALEPLSYSKSDHNGLQGSEVGVWQNGGYTAATPVYTSTENGGISTTSFTSQSPPSF